jgi:hypothetical protein
MTINSSSSEPAETLGYPIADIGSLSLSKKIYKCVREDEERRRARADSSVANDTRMFEWATSISLQYHSWTWLPRLPTVMRHPLAPRHSGGRGSASAVLGPLVCYGSLRNGPQGLSLNSRRSNFKLIRG